MVFRTTIRMVGIAVGRVYGVASHAEREDYRRRHAPRDAVAGFQD